MKLNTELVTCRVIFYDPALGTGAKAAKAYAGSLHFPNGMTFTHDGKALLICETLKARVTKYIAQCPDPECIVHLYCTPVQVQVYRCCIDGFFELLGRVHGLWCFLVARRIGLEGPSRDLFSTFADNLPGMPDNIMKSSDGGYWVAIVLPRHAGSFDVYGFLGRHPLLRTWLSKVRV